MKKCVQIPLMDGDRQVELVKRDKSSDSVAWITNKTTGLCYNKERQDRMPHGRGAYLPTENDKEERLANEILGV